MADAGVSLTARASGTLGCFWRREYLLSNLASNFATKRFTYFFCKTFDLRMSSTRQRRPHITVIVEGLLRLILGCV